MRDIPMNVLEMYSSRRLLGLLEWDRTESKRELQLNRITLERIHDIAAFRYYTHDDAVAHLALKLVAGELTRGG